MALLFRVMLQVSLTTLILIRLLRVKTPFVLKSLRTVV